MSYNGFNDCCKHGGKVKTKVLKNGKTLNICYDAEGKAHVKVVKGTSVPTQTIRVDSKVETKSNTPKTVSAPRSNPINLNQDTLQTLKEYFDSMSCK